LIDQNNGAMKRAKLDKMKDLRKDKQHAAVLNEMKKTMTT